MTKPRALLVLYYTRYVYPLRDTIRTHLYCWGRYSRHRVSYVNVASGYPAGLIERLAPDVIVFHTTFLSMRWTPEIFENHVALCSELKARRCLKIAIPQDEFLHSDLLNRFIRDFDVTHVLSTALEHDWAAIYDGIDRRKVAIRTVLPGYLDPGTLRRFERLKRRRAKRDIDLGYRAWRAAFWLGEHATHKVRVGQEFRELAAAHGLRADISLDEKDVLGGDLWLEFLVRCRAVVGAEGGASVLDRDGSIKTRVEHYLRAHPDAGFREVEQACFPGEDFRIFKACITPRHLEACAAATLQILVEGRYNDILLPWRHYVPVKRDYSDAAQALAVLDDPARASAITTAAYRDVVVSGLWSYPTFVADIEREIIERDAAPSAPWTLRRRLAHFRLACRDHLTWWFTRFENWYSRNNGQKNPVLFRVYRGLARLLAAVN